MWRFCCPASKYFQILLSPVNQQRLVTIYWVLPVCILHPPGARPSAAPLPDTRCLTTAVPQGALHHWGAASGFSTKPIWIQLKGFTLFVCYKQMCLYRIFILMCSIYTMLNYKLDDWTHVSLLFQFSSDAAAQHGTHTWDCNWRWM